MPCPFPFVIRPFRLFRTLAFALSGLATLMPIPVALAEDPPGAIPAFPGAEGFGATATGGRGGKVVYVTNLNPSGPGSLNDALGYHNNSAMQEPRYILFKTSGLISAEGIWDHRPHVEHGEFTLAGHTSPGGVILPGLITHCSSAPCSYDNLIIRHLRSRPAKQENSNDDAIRLNYADYVIIDHSSFAYSDDEVMQISYNENFTIQNSILAETVGAHYTKGGLLLKFASAEDPLDNISIHHNTFNRIGGRLPQVDCADDEANPFCNAGNTLDYEVSNNLLWDPAASVLHKFEAISGLDYDVYLKENFVNNLGYYRASYCDTLFGWYGTQDQMEVFASGNQMNLYPTLQDWEIFGNNNSFCNNHNASTFIGSTPDQRHPHPAISYTETGQLIQYMVDQVGAFPRDPMDRRLMDWVERREIDPTPQSEVGTRYGESEAANDALLFDWTNQPIPYLDADDDGMPDSWEIHNGLDPQTQDHTGKALSLIYTGIEGYDNLEVFLNRLSDHLIAGTALTQGPPATQPYALGFTATPRALLPDSTTPLTFTVTIPDGQEITLVELNLDLLTAAFAWPSPAAVDITASRVGNTFSHQLVLPADQQAGSYAVSVHARNSSGQDAYALLTVKIGQDTFPWPEFLPAILGTDR